jgi:prevent-host-death family protein
MSTIVNIYEAKAKLSSLIQEALAGNDVIIARAGKPCVRLTPLANSRPAKIKLGWLKDVVVVNGDIMEPVVSEEDLAEWEAEEDEYCR